MSLKFTRHVTRPLIAILFGTAFAANSIGHSQTPFNLALRHPFTPFETHGGIHNPYISIDDSAQIAAANNLGLLIYTGAEWNLVPLPNGTQSRSVWAHGGQVVCGGQGFVGVYSENTNTREAEWTDLTDSIQAISGPIEDVWRLYGQVNGPHYQVIIATSDFMGAFDETGAYREWQAGPIVNAFESSVGFGVQTHDSLFVFNNKGLIEHRLQAPEDCRIEGLIWENSLSPPILLTHRRGIFELKQEEWRTVRSPLSEALKSARVNCILKHQRQWFIGTSENGILATSDFHQYEIGHNTRTGLTSNTVLDLKSDENGNVWVAMEGGIELLRYSWPHRIPSTLAQEKVVGYSSLHLDNGEVYWGTSQGLLHQKNESVEVRSIGEVNGPIWSLKKASTDFWVSHPNGAGFLIDDIYYPLVKDEGCWNMWPSESNTRWYIGTYNGILQVRHDPEADNLAERWIVEGRMKGFEESTRFLGQDQDTTWWVTHPYRGAYHLALHEQKREIEVIETYGEEHGFPQPLQVNLCSIDGAIRFATQRGFYRFDPASNAMVIDRSGLTQWVNSEGAFQRLIEDPNGGLWVFEGTEIAHIPLGGSALIKDQSIGIAPMQLSRPIAPFESLEFTPDGRVCVPIETGFVYLDPNRMLAPENAPEVSISNIRHLNASDRRSLPLTSIIELEAGMHALEIQLRSLNSNWLGIQRYQWRIKNVSPAWSHPTPSPNINLSGLEPGNHRLEFRTFIHNNLTGPVRHQNFYIAPFWYQRTSIQGLGLLALVGLFYVYLRRNRQILQAEHKLEKAVQIRARRETEANLEASIKATEAALQKELEDTQKRQLAMKNKELASVTMNLVQKAQLLQTLETGLSEIKPHVPEQESIKIDQLVRIIHDGGKLDDAWEQFTEQFDQVHIEFQQRITERFPHLTKNDLKLCTYLRMNLSSKEISTLMFVTVRAIEVSRSRLRKRLGLLKEHNLIQFIQSI